MHIDAVKGWCLAIAVIVGTFINQEFDMKDFDFSLASAEERNEKARQLSVWLKKGLKKEFFFGLLLFTYAKAAEKASFGDGFKFFPSPDVKSYGRCIKCCLDYGIDCPKIDFDENYFLLRLPLPGRFDQEVVKEPLAWQRAISTFLTTTDSVHIANAFATQQVLNNFGKTAISHRPRNIKNMTRRYLESLMQLAEQEGDVQGSWYLSSLPAIDPQTCARMENPSFLQRRCIESAEVDH